MTAWQQMGTVITVGRVLLQQFKMIDHLVPGLTNREIRYLGTILKHFDDNTAYIPAKKRQNRIGAHYFMANTTIANRWGKDESSVREMLNNWKKYGWIEDASNIPGFENDPVYAKYLQKVRGKSGSPHLVVNVSMICRFLSIEATLDEMDMDQTSTGVAEIINLAATRMDTDFTDPPVQSFTSPEYVPPTFSDYFLLGRDGAPEKWEDLFENEESSAGKGAAGREENLEEPGIEVSVRPIESKSNDSKSATKPSILDDSTVAMHFAKEPKLTDQFPLSINYISDAAEDFVDVVFQLDDITKEGVLDVNSYLPEDEEERISYLDEMYGVAPKIARFNERWGDEMAAYAKRKYRNV